MELSHDELAGVVDLFGALTRSELSRAWTELAFKRGDESALTGVEGAISAYRLVAVEPDAVALDAGETLLTAGPTAFPTLPAGAEDLPHILDVETRTLDRRALGTVVEERFRAEAARAVGADDGERIEVLLDVSYDIEAWAPLELADVRERLDAASE